MIFCVNQFTNATPKKPTGPYPLVTNLDVYLFTYSCFFLLVAFFKVLLRINNKTHNFGLLSCWLDQLDGQRVVSSYHKGQRSSPGQALIFSGSFLIAQVFHSTAKILFTLISLSAVLWCIQLQQDLKKVLIQVKKIRIACQRVGLHGRGGVNHHSLLYGNGRSNKNSGI